MKKSFYLLLVLSFYGIGSVFAQTFTTTDYKKAEWMTARFYGAQRASTKTGGPHNWLLMNHGTGIDFNNDNDGGYDLTGGWFDCGDHPMFGQTQFYSAYILLKGYDLWPAGYADYYSQDYAGYNKIQNFNWEGNGHDPDGIPDILNEVKYATDFFIKASRSKTQFYSQKGQGNADHKHWVTSVHMSTFATAEGGQPRVMYGNVIDASMASFCGATLALMSRVYRSYDSAYADTCLNHALNAYAYAKANPGTAGSPEGSFYGANAKWQDDYASMCTELYYATKDVKYKTEALSYEAYLSNHNFCFGYSNNDDIAAYNLATLGSTVSATLLDNLASIYKSNVDANGIYSGGDKTWGTLRYNGNSAFVVALNNIFKKVTTVDPFIYKQIDYILGNNNSGINNTGISFVVGFGDNSVKYPHHRNIYLNDDDVTNGTVIEIPKRNAQFGYLVGGIRSGTYTDSRDNYQTGEGGIDYSAGLVGAIAYVLSQTASKTPDTMYITSKPFTVGLNKTWPMALTFEPANSYSDVIWTSRDTTIAKVAYNGNVQGIATGSTYITVKTKDGKFIDSTLCTVKVISVTAVSIQPVTLMVGKSAQSIISITPANASNQNVLYSSSDTTIAKISNTGMISAFGVGKATVTVTTIDGSFSDTNSVIVSSNPNLIKAKKTVNMPLIDGSLDETMWDLNQSISKIASGTKNNTGTFGMLWDSTFLYLGIKILDATVTTTNANPWDNDGVELYFDMNHNGGAYDSFDRQWIKVANSSSIWQKIGMTTGAVTTTSSVQSATKIITGGYSLEIAIPWTLLGSKPNLSALYGFDIANDDCDGTTTRGSQIMWVGDANDYQSLSNTGVLQLLNDSATIPPIWNNVLIVSNTQTSITYNAGSKATDYVTSNTTWNAVSDQNWLTVTPNTSVTGNGTLTFTALLNPTFSTRSANVVLSAANTQQQTIVVTQDASPKVFSELVKEDSSVTVYPNPTQSSFVVRNNNKSAMTVIMFDMYGRELNQQSGEAYLFFECSSFNSGIYILKIISDNKISTQSIIIAK